MELAGAVEASRDACVPKGCRNTPETGVAKLQGCELKAVRWMEKFGDWKHAECLAGWRGAESSATWELRTAEPGSFYLDVEYTCPAEDDYSEWRVRCSGTDVTFSLIDMGERAKREAFGGTLPRFRTCRVGVVAFPGQGAQRLSFGPAGAEGKGVRVTLLILTPIQQRCISAMRL